MNLKEREFLADVCEHSRREMIEQEERQFTPKRGLRRPDFDLNEKHIPKGK